MKRHISKEASFREVLAEVSLVDVGSQFKSVLASMGCLVIFFAVSTAGGAGISALGIGFHIPNVVWIALVVFFFVMSFTSEKSYHEWTFRVFFPKMGFVGWLVVTAYITAVIEAFRLTGSFPDELSRFIAFAAIYLILLLPAVLFAGLLELGHIRLIEKRQAAMGEWEQ